MITQRVIGYEIVRKDVIVSRPCRWDGDNFRDLKPVTVEKELYHPIYEDCGSSRLFSIDRDLQAVEVDLGAGYILKAREYRRKKVYKLFKDY